MKKTTTARLAAIGAIAIAGMFASSSAIAGAGWSYTGPTGPSHWKAIDSANYAACADGSAQSPINIVRPTSAKLTALSIKYPEGEAGIFNNGHTVEAEPLPAASDADTLAISGVKYQFLQVHFHAPSEHEMNGLHYPVEVHFVNKTTDGKLAVLGVFIARGAENEAWKPFTDKILAATTDPEATTTSLDWAKMLPANKQTVRYDGSLTTPGCSEGVKWNVFTHPISMSDAQINTFLEAYSGNNRPVQPLNARKLVIDSNNK